MFSGIISEARLRLFVVRDEKRRLFPKIRRPLRNLDAFACQMPWSTAELFVRLGELLREE